MKASEMSLVIKKFLLFLSKNLCKIVITKYFIYLNSYLMLKSFLYDKFYLIIDSF